MGTVFFDVGFADVVLALGVGSTDVVLVDVVLALMRGSEFIWEEVLLPLGVALALSRFSFMQV